MPFLLMYHPIFVHPQIPEASLSEPRRVPAETSCCAKFAPLILPLFNPFEAIRGTMIESLKFYESADAYAFGPSNRVFLSGSH